MASLKERTTTRISAVRRRRPFVDHVVRMQRHYGDVKGNPQAGAVTYFAFLSFFPILALAFAVIGYVARVYPDAQAELLKTIDQVLPDMVGQEDGQISLSAIQDAAPGILSIGLPLMVYSGLGWVSAMRDALQVVFEKPEQQHPNVVIGKGRDLVALISLGVVLILSVAVSGVVTSLAEPILDFLRLDAGAEPLLWIIALALGLAANCLLFFACFKLLGDPDTPTRSLWHGALLGAVGFELLKQLSSYLMASTADQPAFQAFGIALILVVWINYFSRLILYAAAWAHTSPEARRVRDLGARENASMQELTRVDLHEAPQPRSAGTAPVAKSFAAGGATALALVALLRRKTR